MDPRLLTAVVVVLGVPAVLVGYIWLTEQILRPIRQAARPRLRPWLWLAPALALLVVFLAYPSIGTFVRSFQNKAGTQFIGLDNYAWFFSSDTSLVALRNSLIWLVALTALTVGVGLLISLLVDRVRYEPVAKSVIFVPLAISMVAASVIWTFMYDYRTPPEPQVGTLNALLTAAGGQPVAWVQQSQFAFNSLLLVIVMAWMWTGFCMVILSAALKGINPELLEAARVDGGSERQVFRSITLPLMAPTIAVVATTMLITALKAFDIPYVMTSGNFDTQVVALSMINQLFVASNPGRASAIAVVLLLAIIPIMALNIRRFRAQEAIR
ncbi:MAG: carbohydrate ABC transporter permease [Candidatus Limnocylindrales bacterium]